MTGWKVCTRCGESKPFAAFSKHKLGRFGLRPRCRDCIALETAEYRDRTVERRAAYNREYRRVNRTHHLLYNAEWNRAHSESCAAATVRWRSRNPEKVEAHRQLKNALRRGELVRADACEQCGVDGVLHGHHDDYGQPLVVTWLCPRCHAGRR